MNQNYLANPKVRTHFHFHSYFVMHPVAAKTRHSIMIIVERILSVIHTVNGHILPVLNNKPKALLYTQSVTHA